MPYLPNLAFQPYVDPGNGGEPIQELQQLGQTLNSNYDTSIAKYDALNEHIAQLKATLSPPDHTLADNLEQLTRGDLNDIKQNGNWENAQIPLRAAANRLLNNPAILVAQQNAQTRNKLDEYASQAQAQGHHLIQYKDYSNTPTQNPDGSLHKLSLDGVFDKKLDYLSKQQQIFQGLEPSSSGSSVSGPSYIDGTGKVRPIGNTPSGNEGMVYQISKGDTSRKIDEKRVAAVVNSNIDNYLNTDEGQQQLKVLQSKNSENEIPVDYKTAKDMIKHQLMDVGLTHVFKDNSYSSSKSIISPAKQLFGQGDGVVDPNAGTVAVQDPVVPINSDFSNLKDALVKKDRLGKNAILTPGQNGYPAYAPPVLGSNPTSKINGYDNDTLTASPLYQSLSKLYSQQLGTKDPDKINPMISKYLTSLENRSVSPILHATYDPKQMKVDNDFIQNGSVKELPLYDASTGKKYDSMNDPTFKKDFPELDASQGGTSGHKAEEELNKAKMVGRYDQDHPFADITGNDNFTTARKISVGGHDFVAGEMTQDKRSPSHLDNYLGNKISQAHRTGLPVNFSNGDKNIKVVDKGDGTYLVQGKDSQGQDLPLVPLTLEQAKTFLGASGYTTQK